MALRADDVDLNRDRVLVERFQAGDREAFDDLYLRYFERLRRFCQRRVGDAHEAEELAQEAFVRALRAMPAFEGERRFYPWMTVIASRLCVDAHRRRDRTSPVAEIDLGSVDANHDAVFAEVDARYLGMAMERLAPRHREVLQLREFEGWSYQRIAAHYDVTMGTVEALLHRARKALRREFERIAGEGRGWAAVPGLAWLARRVDGLRARASTRAADLADLTTPLALKAASVAVAVGSVALVGGGAPAASMATSAHRPTVTASPAASAAGAVAPAGSAATAQQAHDGAGVTTAHASTPAAATPVLAVGETSVSHARAADYNENAPVRRDVAGTSVGLDPAAIAADATDTVNRLLGRTP